MHVRNKFNVKQVAGLTKPGVYSDGGGLSLRVRPAGTRSWLYICMINGQRREMGLGSALDVSLAQAREKAAADRGAGQGQRPTPWRKPCAWPGHLDLLLPKRSTAEVRHHPALRFNQVRRIRCR